MAGKIRKKLFRQRRFRHLLVGLSIIALLLGVAIVPIERPYNPRITNLNDGFYWAITTLTTVGYGDIVPITTMGRLVSIILQLLGAMMFGITIAMIASSINRYQDEFYWNRLFERMDRLEDNIAEIHKKSDFIVKDNQKN